MASSEPESSDPASLVLKLCSLFTKESPNTALTSTYRFVSRALSAAPLPRSYDETRIMEKIKKKLMKEGRVKEAVAFSNLCCKLQASKELKDRASVLTLLFDLYGTGVDGRFARFANELARSASQKILLQSTDTTTGSDAKYTDSKAEREAENCEDILFRTFIKHDGPNAISESPEHASMLFKNLAEKYEKQKLAWLGGKNESIPTASRNSIEDKTTVEFPMRDLLWDVLYAAQGISGTYITLKKQELGDFSVSIQNTIPRPTKNLVHRLAEIGCLYLKVYNFCKVVDADKNFGLMRQSFLAAIKEELVEYYRLLASLQSQLQVSENESASSSLVTLHRISVWFLDPFQRLKTLASLVSAVSDKKGGALASVLYIFLQHGDKAVSDPIKRILIKTIQPLYGMINGWIFHGELLDVFGEFFVTAHANDQQTSVWQEKYKLEKSMIPLFISEAQAKKILLTGKSIDFLRDVCDQSSMKSDKSVKQTWNPKTAESLFVQEMDNEFQIMLDEAYLRTSGMVMSCLYNEHKLMEHLLAMRSYFLLGQGDFIRHLMDLLAKDLGKPPNMLSVYNLSVVLESAIMATNAQYHHPDILQRLDVRLLESSMEDTGWDVFSLDYNVDGPIGMIFTPQCMMIYLRIFNSLWRAKHIEYILSSIYHSRKTYCRLQKTIPDVAVILQQCHGILLQMVHLIQQVQYYLAFEVMECCWAELLQKIEKAKDVDEIILAHEVFLDAISKRSFLSEESRALRTQLQAIFGRITEFDKIQTKFWSEVGELESMFENPECHVSKKTSLSIRGPNQNFLLSYEEKLTEFKQIIRKTKAELKILTYSYEEMVESFLVMLNDHKDSNLRFLSFRLDFNDFFKSRNAQLRTSLTYSHFKQFSRKF